MVVKLNMFQVQKRRRMVVKLDMCFRCKSAEKNGCETENVSGAKAQKNGCETGHVFQVQKRREEWL
jgi:hypothetical protein